MIERAAAERFSEQFTERVLEPLLVGGELRPVPPIGEQQAHDLAEHPLVPGGEAGLRVTRERLRVARALYPLDALPEPDREEWLLCFALNDLIQATNPTLVGVFGKRRPQKLIDQATSTILRVGAPKTPLAALCRHATLSRLLEISRIDTVVSWWVGSEKFFGTAPPARLLAWKNLRRVNEQKDRVHITEFLPVENPWFNLYERALASLLQTSPLTDLCNADRDQPPFAFGSANLSLLASSEGRRLALRAVERNRPKGFLEHARLASEALASEEQALATARHFISQVVEREQQAAQM